MPNLKIVGICGSLRKESSNRKLLSLTLDLFAKKNCTVEFLDLKKLMLPLFDEDVMNEGTPENAKYIGQQIREAQALIVANPEYNGSVSGPLKNAVDWISVAKNPFKDKVIGLIGTSTGWWGASKSLIHARAIFTHLGGIVVPSQLALPQSEQNLINGQLKQESHQKMLDSVVNDVLRFSEKFR
ncbi:MAG: NAD(P)H-dependent oxidoreductase [Oligoflexia bacterium]|nr:NAD(P)H-dependent oxidoreductase [Oligoflexia bacterium]